MNEKLAEAAPDRPDSVEEDTNPGGVRIEQDEPMADSEIEDKLEDSEADKRIGDESGDSHMIGYVNSIIKGIEHSINWKSKMTKDLETVSWDNEWGKINQLQNYECEERFWDDMSGEELEPNLIRLARAEEMAEVRKHNVYTKVPITQC